MPAYKIIGKRFLRKYTAPEATPVYAAATDAARIVRELCNVPWEASAVRQAEMPPHGDESNPQNREKFDAALFCAGHADNMHRAYANAAVYRYALPSAAVGKTLTGLAVRVTSDPYNAAGARVHVFTGATGEIPTNCRTVRGDGDDGQPLADGTVAAGVAPRETKTIKGQDYWYPVTAEASLAPTGGIVLQKYLYIAVVLESYATTRGNWLEGASYADNLVSVTLSAAVAGWTDGGTYDLCGSSSLRLINLATRETDAILSFSGDVRSIVRMDLSDATAQQAHQVAVVQGDFDEGSLDGMPGLVVWDYATRQTVTLVEDAAKPVPSGVKAAMRQPGVSLRLTSLGSLGAVYKGYVPATRDKALHLALAWDSSAASYVVSSDTPAGFDPTPSAEVCRLFVPQTDDTGAAFYADHIDIQSVVGWYKDSSGNQKKDETVKTVRVPFVAGGEAVAGYFGAGELLVAGICGIAGDTSAVKLLRPNGKSANLLFDLAPDVADGFRAEVIVDGGIDDINVQLKGFNLARAAMFESPAYDAVASVPSWFFPGGTNELPGDYEHEKGTVRTAWPFGGMVALNAALLLTGRFSRVGGTPASGAAIAYINVSTYLPGQLADETNRKEVATPVVIPLDVGAVELAAAFFGSSGPSYLDSYYKSNPTPSHVSHLLVLGA